MLKKFFYISWTIIVLLVLCFYAFWILPHKGVDLTDHGYALYNAQMLLSGTSPTLGFGGIINAIFMFIGFKQYLFFEQAFLVLTVGSVLLFVYSSYRIKISIENILTIGLLVLIAINTNITYLANYQTAPQVLLLLGLAVLSQAEQSEIKHFLLITSAIILSFATMANLSLLPTVFSTSILLIFYFRNKNQQRLYVLSFLGFTGLLFLIYLNSPHTVFNLVSYANYIPEKTGGINSFITNLKALVSVLLLKDDLYVYVLIGISFIRLVVKFSKIQCHQFKTIGAIFIVTLFALLFPVYSIFHSYAQKPPSSLFLITQYIGVLAIKVLWLTIICFFTFDTRIKRLAIVGVIITSYAVTMSIAHGPFTHISLFSASSFTIASLLFLQHTQMKGFFK